MTYQTNSKGIITSPGKFEGEPEYVLHFWELACEGEADDTYVYGFHFKLNREDRTNYPQLRHSQDLYLWEDNQGFVYHRLDDEPRFLQEGETSGG